ncbi:hypothetical protein [Photobacterium leiognathi]|uniref:hypothetical protein n=1 Tax=Photobacterium leiognathi TaxID=553611 RepID=UPI002980EC65|nr:hypothetical protein [Photobacterium leiognathi]
MIKVAPNTHIANLFPLKNVLFNGAQDLTDLVYLDACIHTIGLTSTKTLTDNWCLIATTDATIADCDHSNVLYKVDGSQMTGLNIQRHDSYATIRIDKMNGQPDSNNSALPIDWITFEKESGKALTMQMSWMGRLYECGVDGEWYGAEVC